MKKLFISSLLILLSASGVMAEVIKLRCYDKNWDSLAQVNIDTSSRTGCWGGFPCGILEVNDQNYYWTGADTDPSIKYKYYYSIDRVTRKFSMGYINFGPLFSGICQLATPKF